MRRTVNGILVGLGACATLSSGGCCLASSAPTPPPAVPSPNLAPPEPAPPGCPTIELAILGTWSREGFVEEYRAGGVYVLNGHEGTVRWLGEGRVFLDVPPDFHEEYTLALADRDLLLAADRGGVGTVYQRTSTPPTADASCWDVRDEIVGRWVGGQFRELYEPDGTYRVNELHGSYVVTGNGRVRIVTEAGEGDYYFALTSPSTAVAMMQREGAPLTRYTRVP
jgi:hypothetical protein